MIKRVSIPESTKRQVIIRDKAMCQVCGLPGIPVKRYGKSTVIIPLVGTEVLPWQDYNGRASAVFELDHIKPVFLGGTNLPENLRVTCGLCNRRKNSMVYRREAAQVHPPA